MSYTEKFTAQVNVENGHEEVILRGQDSVHTLVVRPQGEDKGKFIDGETYNVTITKDIPAKAKTETPAAAKTAKPKKQKAAVAKVEPTETTPPIEPKPAE